MKCFNKKIVFLIDNIIDLCSESYASITRLINRLYILGIV